MWPIAMFYIPIGSHEVQFVGRGDVGDIAMKARNW